QTDEAGKQTVQFSDKDGHIILKKVQIGDSPSAQYAGWLSTYYVYDDYGQLRFVIPPKAVELLIQNGWMLTQSIADELCFRYEYDQRNRLIIAKVPGVGEEWSVYDARDRKIMVQDANLRQQHNWLVTEYDSQNRPLR